MQLMDGEGENEDGVWGFPYGPGLGKNHITLFMCSPTGILGAQEKAKCVLGNTKQPMRRTGVQVSRRFNCAEAPVVCWRWGGRSAGSIGWGPQFAGPEAMPEGSTWGVL